MLLESNSVFSVIFFDDNKGLTVNTWLKSSRIKLTGLAISKNYIAICSSSGSIHMYGNQSQQYLGPLFLEDTSVTLAAFSPNDKILGYATKNGHVAVVDHGLKEKCQVTKLRSIHFLEHSQITCLKWNKLGNSMFIGNSTGIIAVANVTVSKRDFFRMSAEIILRLDSSIVQIDELRGCLVVSTISTSYLCCTERETFKPIGKKSRNVGLGACFYPCPALREPIVYCGRPGNRLWEVGWDGQVLTTHHFNTLLTVSTYPSASREELQRCQLSPDSAVSFTNLHCIGHYLLSVSTNGIFIIDPVNSALAIWHTDISYEDICWYAVLDCQLVLLLRNNTIRRFCLMDIPELVQQLYDSQQYSLCVNALVSYTQFFLDLSQGIETVVQFADQLLEILKNCKNTETSLASAAEFREKLKVGQERKLTPDDESEFVSSKAIGHSQVTLQLPRSFNAIKERLPRLVKSVNSSQAIGPISSPIRNLAEVTVKATVKAQSTLLGFTTKLKYKLMEESGAGRLTSAEDICEIRFSSSNIDDWNSFQGGLTKSNSIRQSDSLSLDMEDVFATDESLQGLGNQESIAHCQLLHQVDHGDSNQIALPRVVQKRQPQLVTFDTDSNSVYATKTVRKKRKEKRNVCEQISSDGIVANDGIRYIDGGLDQPIKPSPDNDGEMKKHPRCPSVTSLVSLTQLFDDSSVTVSLEADQHKALVPGPTVDVKGILDKVLHSIPHGFYKFQVIGEPRVTDEVKELYQLLRSNQPQEDLMCENCRSLPKRRSHDLIWSNDELILKVLQKPEYITDKMKLCKEFGFWKGYISLSNQSNDVHERRQLMQVLLQLDDSTLLQPSSANGFLPSECDWKMIIEEKLRHHRLGTDRSTDTLVGTEDSTSFKGADDLQRQRSASSTETVYVSTKDLLCDDTDDEDHDADSGDEADVALKEYRHCVLCLHCQGVLHQQSVKTASVSCQTDQVESKSKLEQHTECTGEQRTSCVIEDHIQDDSRYSVDDRSLTWVRLIYLILQSLSPQKCVELLQFHNLPEFNLPSHVRNYLVALEMISAKQRLVAGDILEKLDAELWIGKRQILPKQAETLLDYSDEDRTFCLGPDHWGLQTDLGSFCPHCGVALYRTVDSQLNGIIAFPCGHVYHQYCHPDKCCRSCYISEAKAVLKNMNHPTSVDSSN